MRKLGRPTDHRNALLRNLLTDLLLNGKIETTEAKAKELKPIADKIIHLAVTEKDNFEEVEVTVKKAKLDANGNKVTENVKSKNGKEFKKVVKEETKVKKQKDMPSRLNARRKIITYVNKKDNEDVLAKLFGEIANAQKDRVGGYTRIVKVNPRKGDNAPLAILEIL